MAYRITKHAVKRFRTRGRLVLNSFQKERAYDTIRIFLERGHSHPYVKLYPAYMNMKGISDIIVSGDWRFYLKGDTIVTCYFTPNSKAVKFEI